MNGYLVGITERGDAGRDLSWVAPCVQRSVDGAIVITKTLTKPCGEAILDLHRDGFPLILHATCTGWGGSALEPNVFSPDQQLQSVRRLVDNGFPHSRVVIRVDPILPSSDGFLRAESVFRAADGLGLISGGARVRISVIDEYAHAKRRMAACGVQPCFPVGQFSASKSDYGRVAAFLSDMHARYGVLAFETCAEPKLSEFDTKGIIRASGCVSETDLTLMGLPVPENAAVNMQNRRGCLCLACKKELLSHKHPCVNKCAYCYWKD